MDGSNLRNMRHWQAQAPSSASVHQWHPDGNSTASGRASASDDFLQVVLEELSYLCVTGCIDDKKPIASAGGGYCDVFVGYVYQGEKRVKVAIRQLRAFITLKSDFKKMLARELKLWSSLEHPNILPLYGFSVEEDLSEFSFVSEWMENGRADKYVKANPECNIGLMILGIGEGLKYLHKKNVVHGDMKAVGFYFTLPSCQANNVTKENVLISPTGQPLICDFGISRAIAASGQMAASSSRSNIAGSLRWMAPELVNGSMMSPRHSKRTDVWAFGMTVYELFTGQIPYAHITSAFHAGVLLEIAKGALPTLPKEFSVLNMTTMEKKLWEICHMCWNSDENDRPSIVTIVSHLRRSLQPSTNIETIPESFFEPPMTTYQEIVLNNVLSFNPQSRHSTRVHPYVHWDLRCPAESARSADTGHTISPQVRAYLATNPPIKFFRISCGLFPSSSWNIAITNVHGVTVDDVLRGLHQGLRHSISSAEWARIPRQNQSRIAEAFYDRQRHSSDPQYEHSSGVRRIDWLLKHSSFVGLSPSIEQPYTWILTLRRNNSLETPNNIVCLAE